MDGWLARGSLGVLLVAGAIAIAWWPHPTPASDPPIERAATDARSAHPFGSGLSFATGPTPTSPIFLFVGDGGVGAPGVDAALDEPVPATGVLARAITSALCPPAAQLLCGARSRAGCDPLPTTFDDDGNEVREACGPTLQRQCGDWVMAHYGSAEDDLVLSQDALTACLEALRADAAAGQAVSLDPVCNELARDAAEVGRACSAEWYPCGHDGQCWEGTCQPLATLGQPCDEAPCSRGLFCTAGLCERPTPRGGACDDESTCERRGDYCIDGVCATHVAEGGACVYDGDCAVASRCLLGRCQRVPSTTCTLEDECGRGRTCLGPYTARCEVIEDFGARCVNATDCEPWLSCIEGRCTTYADDEYGTREANAACEPGGAQGGCARGLVCLYTIDGYRCQAGVGVGERCEAGRCLLGTLCVWRVQDGVCAPSLCGVVDYFADRDGEE